MRLGRCQIHKGFHRKDVPALGKESRYEATRHQQLCPSVLLKGRNSKGIFIIPSTRSCLNMERKFPLQMGNYRSLSYLDSVRVQICLCFFFCLFSVWGTFPCYLLHFGAKTSILLNVGAKICYLHCSSIFPWFYMIFPWCSLIYPKCSSILT